MNWLIVLIVVAGAGAVFGLGRVRSNPVKGAETMKSFTSNGREGIRLLLARIEREEAPDFVMGAMCYRPAAPPDRFEYICPVCGGRTWYSGETAETLAREADAMRRAMLEIGGNPYFLAMLDESAFCPSCAGGSPEPPRFRLDIVYARGDTVSSVVGLYDLQLLAGLVRGELSFTDSYDARLPLKDSLSRLRTLLGVQPGEDGCGT